MQILFELAQIYILIRVNRHTLELVVAPKSSILMSVLHHCKKRAYFIWFKYKEQYPLNIHECNSQTRREEKHT